MKKTIALVAAGLVAVVVLAKTTNFCSYASTLWSQAKTAVKDSVPTKFDIDRIRHEIASLDGDLDRMISPIAQHTVAVKRLQTDVARDEQTLDEQKKVLLKATEAVRNKNPNDTMWYGGQSYPVALIRQKISEDFKAYRRLERTVEARKTELAAKESTLKAAQEQLQSFISKKKEFEVALAQLEAEHEVNQVAAIGTDVQIDDTRAAQIARDLEDLKNKIEEQKTKLEMRKGILAVRGIQLNQPQQAPGVDLDAIQAHLEGKGDVKTASK
jgi:chromosome segregation ATPase